MLKPGDERRIGPGAILLWRGNSVCVVREGPDKGGYFEGTSMFMSYRWGKYNITTVHMDSAWNLNDIEDFEVLRPSAAWLEAEACEDGPGGRGGGDMMARAAATTADAAGTGNMETVAKVDGRHGQQPQGASDETLNMLVKAEGVDIGETGCQLKVNCVDEQGKRTYKGYASLPIDRAHAFDWTFEQVYRLTLSRTPVGVDGVQVADADAAVAI